jgi:hypothetical protein
MSNPMDYRGLHRKYVKGSSEYEVYYYGDVVDRNGVSYVCNVESTKGYLPEDPDSGFSAIGGASGAGVSGEIGGGSYT